MQQGTDAVNYKLKLTNIQIQGFEDYKFEKFSFDPQALYFHGVCHFNHLHVETDYEIIGKILAVQINGKGRHITDTESCSGTLKIKGEIIKKKGKDYFNPIHGEAKISISNFTSDFNGLFSDNKEITKAANLFVKENSDAILKEVLPMFEGVAADIILKSIDTYTRNVPYKELFLE